MIKGRLDQLDEKILAGYSKLDDDMFTEILTSTLTDWVTQVTASEPPGTMVMSQQAVAKFDNVRPSKAAKAPSAAAAAAVARGGGAVRAPAPAGGGGGEDGATATAGDGGGKDADADADSGTDADAAADSGGVGDADEDNTAGGGEESGGEGEVDSGCESCSQVQGPEENSPQATQGQESQEKWPVKCRCCRLRHRSPQRRCCRAPRLCHLPPPAGVRTCPVPCPFRVVRRTPCPACPGPTALTR
jgi:hypothetical protein